jgi:hypothetical protein
MGGSSVRIWAALGIEAGHLLGQGELPQLGGEARALGWLDGFSAEAALLVLGSVEGSLLAHRGVG